MGEKRAIRETAAGAARIARDGEDEKNRI